jgi:peroxiredoxin
MKVVLAFYPGAFTSVCAKEMCTFRDSLAKLSALKAQVVGISVNDPFSNKAFADANILNFPLLSDYKREAVKSYGVKLKDFAGLEGYTAAKRSVFILDRESIVRYAWVSDNPGIEPNYEEIEQALEEMD